MLLALKYFPGGETGCGKSAFRNKSVPQGLKPHCKQNICGTAEAVPLRKTGFFRSRPSAPSQKPALPRRK
jgi:hypothetical protein